MTNQQPNVLFILSDQHNAKVLGHQGHPDVRTPNLDRMAAGGVRCDNAITQNPICTPSRVSWLSGQYCHNHGYYGLSGPIPKGLPTVLGHFRKGGYRTAAIGKIHCPENWVENDSDLFHETAGCSIGGRSSEYAAYLAEKGLTDLEDHLALREFGDNGIQTVEGRPSAVSYQDGQEGWSVRQAMAFMGQCAQEAVPFFAHVSLPKPHQCYTPAQPFWDLYDESRLTLPSNADYEMKDKAPHMRRSAEGWRTREWQLIEPKTFAAGRLRKLHGYLGSVSHVDHAVGELLDWLESNHLSDNTIVIYSSDHGDYACEHGIMEKAPGICADAITRIPMIWHWPGRFKAGHVAKEIVETVDLANTLCALTGLEAMETADGKDISQMLKGASGDVRRLGVTEFAWSKSVRKGQYRLVYYPPEMFADEYPEGFGELYDLAHDPWEMRNLFFVPEYADVVGELQRELMNWLITTTRPATIYPPAMPTSAQSPIQYQNAVNADGKVHPDRVRTVKDQNYRNYI
ncbi:MAG: sulfatase-like hydrolase/transferase [Candidatus Marinimicrobia bacterium]|nr:sulfatase-like hydrolase/transferase [Candidatus Neomarinimicrobiota bacterium]